MTETVTLGGRQFKLQPLKLGQLRHVLDALEQMSGKTGGALIEAAAHVAAVGLAPAHPDLTADAILDLEASIPQLNEAVAAILRVAGLQPLGESQPGAGPAINSPASTPPSPPAAVTPTP